MKTNSFIVNEIENKIQVYLDLPGDNEEKQQPKPKSDTSRRYRSPQASSKAAAPDNGTNAPDTFARLAEESPAVTHTTPLSLRMIRLGAYLSNQVSATCLESNTGRRRFSSTVRRDRELK